MDGSRHMRQAPRLDCNTDRQWVFADFCAHQQGLLPSRNLVHEAAFGKDDVDSPQSAQVFRLMQRRKGKKECEYLLMPLPEAQEKDLDEPLTQAQKKAAEDFFCQVRQQGSDTLPPLRLRTQMRQIVGNSCRQHPMEVLLENPVFPEVEPGAVLCMRLDACSLQQLHRAARINKACMNIAMSADVACRSGVVFDFRDDLRHVLGETPRGAWQRRMQNFLDMVPSDPSRTARLCMLSGMIFPLLDVRHDAAPDLADFDWFMRQLQRLSPLSKEDGQTLLKSFLSQCAIVPFDGLDDAQMDEAFRRRFCAASFAFGELAGMLGQFETHRFAQDGHRFGAASLRLEIKEFLRRTQYARMRTHDLDSARQALLHLMRHINSQALCGMRSLPDDAEFSFTEAFNDVCDLLVRQMRASQVMGQAIAGGVAASPSAATPNVNKTSTKRRFSGARI